MTGTQTGSYIYIFPKHLGEKSLDQHQFQNVCIHILYKKKKPTRSNTISRSTDRQPQDMTEQPPFSALIEREEYDTESSPGYGIGPIYNRRHEGIEHPATLEELLNTERQQHEYEKGYPAYRSPQKRISRPTHPSSVHRRATQKKIEGSRVVGDVSNRRAHGFSDLKARSPKQSFLGDEADTGYDSDDPFIERHTSKDILIRLTTRLSPYGKLFWIEVTEIAMYVSFIIISLIALTGIAEVNTFVFVLCGTIVNGLIFVIHVPAVIYYWHTNRDLIHTHIFAITAPITVGIPLMIVGWFAMGRWIYSYASCCSMANSQPNPADAEEINRFIVAYAILVVTSVITVTTYPKSIMSHLYPHVVISTPIVNLHTTEIISEKVPETGYDYEQIEEEEEEDDQDT